MSAPRTFLAVDLGASSGRVMAGKWDGARFALEEQHRFPNGGVQVGKRLYWNLLGLWKEIQIGLRKAASDLSGIASIGVDTWGVDFGLLDRDGQLLGFPCHYRDRRTEDVWERVVAELGRTHLFERTGLQFLPFNTIYQLAAMRGTAQLGAADRFLMMPDLFHWLLTGQISNEYTDATTTQLLDPRTGTWAADLIEALDLPRHIFGPIAPPGTDLGPVQAQVARESGLPADVRVVLPGSHDTASAVAAVPAEAKPSRQPSWCYISSGTWSLMGIELPTPLIDDRVLARNFTNEGGVFGTIRLLKNIAGLWLIQECRRIWAREGKDYTWEALMQAATEAPPLATLIDPDDATFLAPDDMPEAIAAFCRKTGQPVPDSHGAVIRTALESLALRYRQVLCWLEELTGGTIETIHIVGGGSQNTLLCQMTADACGRRVVTGPVEATALGNVAVQAIAQGELADLAQARQAVRASFEPTVYEPAETAVWEEAASRWEHLCNLSG